MPAIIFYPLLLGFLFSLFTFFLPFFGNLFSGLFIHLGMYRCLGVAMCQWYVFLTETRRSIKLPCFSSWNMPNRLAILLDEKFYETKFHRLRRDNGHIQLFSFWNFGLIVYITRQWLLIPISIIAMFCCSHIKIEKLNIHLTQQKVSILF